MTLYLSQPTASCTLTVFEPHIQKPTIPEQFCNVGDVLLVFMIIFKGSR